MISRERQVWHCFGCGKGGDIFSFVQEMENMEFPEALRFLASKAGVTLEGGNAIVNGNQKNRLKEICGLSANFYHSFLTQMDAADEARAYLIHRGVQSETIDTWQIGYAPEQWDLLTKYITKKGKSIDDLVAAGMTIKRDRQGQRGPSFYDRFRGRIMFPIHDIYGAIVGFSGRLLKENPDMPGGKYINTPQTEVYDKSAILFGLYFAKKAIKEKGYVVITEGQMDVIASHQAGITEVVASSGTALTIEHIKILKRYTNTLLLCFDADEAGKKAAIRGIDEALSEGCAIKIVRLPADAGKDPDECIKKDPALWQQAIADAVDIMEWLFEIAFAGKNLDDVMHKQGIVDALLPRIHAMSLVMAREHWLTELAGRLRVETAVLRDELKKLSRSSYVSVSAAQKVVQPLVTQKTVSVFDQNIERLLLFVLHGIECYPLLHKALPEKIWKESIYAQLYEMLDLVYSTGTITIDQIREKLSGIPQLSKQLDLLLLKASQDIYDIPISQISSEVLVLIQHIKKQWITHELQRLHHELIDAARKKDTLREQALLLEVKQLQQEL